ncbi:MAG: SWIM zinc finger family protein [Acidimicrobiales bacterium]
MAGRGWNDPWNRFPASVPLPAKDGIATSKQRGAMAGTWWSKRFVEVLESYGLGGRMGRGRRYARSGQVMSLDVQAGLLVAQVQGSRPTPYVLTVRAATPTEIQWKEIDEVLRSRVGFAAKLLAGEVPAELEAVFATAHTQLLPSTWAQLDANCNCPDWENPCKHIAAALYVFADRLDGDPWLLLAWRGRTRDQILGPLRARATGAGRDVEQDVVAPWWPFGPRETLPEGAVAVANSYADDVVVVDPADPSDAVLQRCEPLNITAGNVDVVVALFAAYDALARRL